MPARRTACARFCLLLRGLMRFRGWTGTPPLKPPLYYAAQHQVQVPAAGTSTFCPPSPPPPPPPPPALVLRARHAVQQRVAHVESSSNPLDGARRQLGQVLLSLPPISGSPDQQPLALRLDHDVHSELKQWRMACWVAYTMLSGPLADHQSEFRNKVVRIVAHTIRLLIRVKMFSIARELDRAFFTTSASPWARDGTRNQGGDSAKADDLTTGRPRRLRAPRNPVYAQYPLGRGLGLKRGNINVTWMQSMSLRLRTGADADGSDNFDQLLGSLKVEQSEDGVSPDVLAFLLRHGELLERKLQDDGWRPQRAKRDVRQVVDGILADKKAGRNVVVRMAWVETALSELEADVARGRQIDEGLLARVEEEAQALLNETEDIAVARRTAAGKETSRHSTPGRFADDNRAQTLHIVIRVLLLQARCSYRLPPERRTPVFRKSVASACKVYASLVNLVSTANQAGRLTAQEMSKVRQRQTSTLIRIAWTSVGSRDFDEIESFSIARDGSADEAATMDPDLPSIHQLLDTLDLTLAASTALNPPAPIGISAQFWRRLIYTLTLPSSPSRRAPPDSPAVRPSWPLLRRAMSTIHRCRRHDAALARSAQMTPALTHKPKNLEAIFIRTSFILHLVRAVLVGGPTSSSAPSTASASSLPRSRLEFLLQWIEEMEQTSWPSPEPGPPGRNAREVVRRTVVRSAVEEVLRQEWDGVAFSDWRKDMREMVRPWQENQELDRVASDGADLVSHVFRYTVAGQLGSRHSVPLTGTVKGTARVRCRRHCPLAACFTKADSLAPRKMSREYTSPVVTHSHLL